MKFEEVLTVLRNGGKARRPGWLSENYWVSDRDGNIDYDDFMADDWIVKEPILVANSANLHSPWLVSEHGWKTKGGLTMRPHSEIEALYAASAKIRGIAY